MADRQYDVSHEMQKLFEKKHKMRQETKSYFAKLMNNPHRSLANQPFDPILFRFNAMKAYQYEHFRYTPKTTIFLFLAGFVPLLGLTYIVQKKQDNAEQQYRRGEVAYKDRKNKFSCY